MSEQRVTVPFKKIVAKWEKHIKRLIPFLLGSKNFFVPYTSPTTLAFDDYKSNPGQCQSHRTAGQGHPGSPLRCQEGGLGPGGRHVLVDQTTLFTCPAHTLPLPPSL